MNRLQTTIRTKLAALNRREGIILLSLVALLVVYGADFIFNRVYLGPDRALRAAVAEAKEQVRRQQMLLSREQLIHDRYQQLDSPRAAVQDTVLNETSVLRALADLAGKNIHIKSVVPRLGHHAGRQIMFVALDFEGSFAAALGYVENILHEMPSEVGSLSLVPRPEGDGGVVCRLSIRVDYFEP
jgi:hypothetical protein